MSRIPSASADGLPNSNHGQEDGISHADAAIAGIFDPRTIPDRATEATWCAPDGHRIRRLDWPVPVTGERGSILFLPGRGDAYEKYLETYEHWRQSGWRVTAADWRGQAGSGRLGADAVTGHIDDFALWVDDLAAFWREWTADRAGPHVLAGHSMGGHLVLRAVAERAVLPDALVLSAPMLGLLPQNVPHAVKHQVARFMSQFGDSRRPAWKWSEKPGEVPAARILLLTHDKRRYEDELWWREKRPELVMGPGSWGWVERAIASIRSLEAPGVLERVELPVFLFATSTDKLVSFAAIRRAAARLPNVETLWFGSEARHEILREVDDVRDRALAEIDAFLEAHLAR